MKASLQRTALLASIVAAASTAQATPTTKVSLDTVAEQATSIEARHAKGEAAAPELFTTHNYAGGEMMMAWGDQRVLTLCKNAVYLKLPGMKPAASELSVEQRQMVAYEAMMAGIGVMVAVGGLAGDMVEVAHDGSEVRSQAERPWAYGVERYDVISRRAADGALRVRALKTETVNTTEPEDPDASFSTRDDQEARLRELPAVGSWAEVTFYTTPQKGEIDPAYVLRDWVSVTGDNAATVGEAKQAHGCD